MFIPAPMAQGMRSDFFLEGPFMPPRMKMDRDPLGGLADMFGQMPGDFEQNCGLNKNKTKLCDILTAAELCCKMFFSRYVF